MSLLSTHNPSDPGLNINVHPLVLLTISDYITRHTLRSLTQPIVGALLGKQSGRSISLEHAFEALLQPNDQGDAVLDEVWFKDRLQQYKDVHQSPLLDLVGWFTTAPATGPEALHVPIHQQISQNYNETAVLLAFHPSGVLGGKSTGGKLPLTIYESVFESGGDAEDSMDTGEKEARLELRFRELPYCIETGEAEMIGVDFVAKGGGNATAVDGAVKVDKKPQGSQTTVGQIEGDGAQTSKDTNALDDSKFLSAEDGERKFPAQYVIKYFTDLWSPVIASLTTRANAIKMLHTRIKLLKSYLTSLPPSAPTSSSNSSEAAPVADTTSNLEVDYPLLRSIQALLSRLPLLLPFGDLSNFKQETLAEKSDVGLVSLLGSLGQSVKEARELGRKFAVVEASKNTNKKLDIGFGRSLDVPFENDEGLNDALHDGFAA